MRRCGSTWKAVKARKDKVVGESISGLTTWLDGTKNLRVLRGHARFTGPHQIEVDGAGFEAEKIFINVGGRPSVPGWRGIADIPYLTNPSMMAVDFLPEHLVVIGGQLHRPRVRADVPALRAAKSR